MRNRYFLFLILILFSVFWIWWTPGLRVANDFSFISTDFLKLQFNPPFTWSERGAEGMGEYGAFTLWSYPVNFIFGIFAFLNLVNFEIWERILILAYIGLGSFSTWKFLSSFSFSSKTKFIGSLFYLTSTYPILLIDGGQLSIALAYALFPLCYLTVYNSIYSSLESKLKAGLLVTLLGIFDVRFIYILFLLMVLRCLFDLILGREKGFKKTIFGWIYTGFITGGVVLTLNIFWLLVQIKTPLQSDIFNSFTKLSGNFVNIGHSFLFLSPHWYKNVFGKISELRFEFFLIPLLVFAAPVLKRKDKNVAFWMTMALVSAFLVKGGGDPLPDVYSWLYSNLPGFSLFRDSTKFFFLLGLSYTLLISTTVEELFKLPGKKISTILFLLFTFYFLLLIRPVFLQQMTGTFSIQPLEKDYSRLTQTLKNDSSFGRVFWIPGTKPLSYFDQNHTIVEASRVFNRTPFVYGVKGTYELHNFLREAPYMGQIFDIAGIAYIVYPPIDAKRDNAEAEDFKYYYLFINQLQSLPWIENPYLLSASNLPVLKTKKHQDKLFLAANSWIVVGSADVLNEATKSADLNLSNNALFYPEQKGNLSELYDNLPDARIVLSKKSEIDLAANLAETKSFIFPAEFLDKSPDKSGWWKRESSELIPFRSFLQEKYGIDTDDFDYNKGWAVGEDSVKLEIKGEKLKKDKILLARVLESSRSGQISFYQDSELIGKINTKAEEDNLRWFEAGKLINSSDLAIKTDGDINVVNTLLILDQAEWDALKKKSNKLAKNLAMFKPNSVLPQKANMTYEMINPTRYKITISNLASPEILVFSETFHSGWELNGKKSLPAYGFLNSFVVDQSGEYFLEFAPQKYILPGTLFSLSSLAVIVFLIFKSRWRK